MCKYVCTCVFCTGAVRDTVRHLALKRLPCQAFSFSSPSVSFHAVVTCRVHYFKSHHSPHQDPQTSDCPSLRLHLSIADSRQRLLQAWNWAESLLTILGGHKAIFMQPATHPFHPLLAWAKNSQWSCSGRNPTLSLSALSQEKREQSWRHRNEAKPQNQSSKVRGSGFDTPLPLSLHHWLA